MPFFQVQLLLFWMAEKNYELKYWPLIQLAVVKNQLEEVLN
jgi:hypothetical protein